MSTDRVITQDEIDSVFSRRVPPPKKEAPPPPQEKTERYDFRRPDRIAKDQLRAIHLLHENFARSLASSLSAYLRAYVSVNLVSVEQLSFKEFAQCLPSPTCLISLGMRPLEGSAVLELNPSLVFPVLEMLLGGSGRLSPRMRREITEIEQSVLEGMHRLILQNLKAAWHSVTNLEFAIESHETEPSLLQILAPNEALVAISLEVRVGENSGMMNIGIPSIMIKMLRQKFDQQWSVRKTEVTEAENQRVLRLMKPAKFLLDARLQGPTVVLNDLLQLEAGDVLRFDYQTDKPVDLLVNGKVIYQGQVVGAGRKRGFVIGKPVSQLT
ncbi:MAG TPA: flagellar motor switch protein FliM [Bryobacteraceae bacterium]|jgi:flagellar motor switch protein FliM|nr:flagellar motor switch protein FliM [Bryobacteraceae bacterium]